VWLNRFFLRDTGETGTGRDDEVTGDANIGSFFGVKGAVVNGLGSGLGFGFSGDTSIITGLVSVLIAVLEVRLLPTKKIQPKNLFNFENS
jgi:hypothetical protein